MSKKESNNDNKNDNNGNGIIERFLLNNNRHWFINFLLNTFDKMIPESTWVKDFHDLPGITMYISAFLFNLVWWSIFIYFVSTSYISGVTDTFISLDSSSGDCKEVPFTLTGTYLADKSGHWENNKNFDDSSAIYRAEFLSFESSTKHYKYLIETEIGGRFNQVGEIGKYRDLAWNLIALSALTYTNLDKGRIRFTSVVDIGTIYDKIYSLGGIASNQADVKRGSCVVDINYDSIKSEISLDYNYANASTNCKSFATTFGFNPIYDDDFTFTMNLKAHTTATAINYGIITPADLIEIVDDPTKGYSYNYDDDDNHNDNNRRRRLYNENKNNEIKKINDNTSPRKLREKMVQINKVKYGNKNHQVKIKSTSTSSSSTWHNYYDSKYSGMPPISCLHINNQVVNSTCFLRFSLEDETAVYGYPISKHYLGTNCYNQTEWPSSWYTSDPTKNGNWVDTDDHSINILLGLIVFPDESDAISFGIEAFERRTSIKNGDLDVPDSVFSSMRSIVDLGQGIYRYSQEDVCGIDTTTNQNRTCFLIVFNQFGPDYYVNPHNYQLFAGACRNSLYNSLAIKSLGEVSPAPLIERYYECTLEPYDSFFNALGLSLGNSDIYARWSFFVFMFFFVLFLHKFYNFDPKLGEYKSNLQEAQEAETETETEEAQGVDKEKKRKQEKEGNEELKSNNQKQSYKNNNNNVDVDVDSDDDAENDGNNDGNSGGISLSKVQSRQAKEERITRNKLLHK